MQHTHHKLKQQVDNIQQDQLSCTTHFGQIKIMEFELKICASAEKEPAHILQ